MSKRVKFRQNIEQAKKLLATPGARMKVGTAKGEMPPLLDDLLIKLVSDRLQASSNEVSKVNAEEFSKVLSATPKFPKTLGDRVVYCQSSSFSPEFVSIPPSVLPAIRAKASERVLPYASPFAQLVLSSAFDETLKKAGMIEEHEDPLAAELWTQALTTLMEYEPPGDNHRTEIDFTSKVCNDLIVKPLSSLSGLSLAFDTRTTFLMKTRPDIAGAFTKKGNDIRDAGELFRVEIKMIPKLAEVDILQHHDFKRMIVDLPAVLQRLSNTSASQEEMKAYGLIIIVDPVNPVRMYSLFVMCEPVFPSDTGTPAAAAAAGADTAQSINSLVGYSMTALWDAEFVLSSEIPSQRLPYCRAPSLTWLHTVENIGRFLGMLAEISARTVLTSYMEPPMATKYVFPTVCLAQSITDTPTRTAFVGGSDTESKRTDAFRPLKSKAIQAFKCSLSAMIYDGPATRVYDCREPLGSLDGGTLVYGVVVIKLGRFERAVNEVRAVRTARAAQANHILHQYRQVVITDDGSFQIMPRVEMLSTLTKHSDRALLFLRQLPALLRELQQLRILCVDVKPANFGFLNDALVAVDCDGMVFYSDPGQIEGPFACTMGHCATEIESGATVATLRSDVQAFAKLIIELVDCTRLPAELQGVINRALAVEPQQRPSMDEFIRGLS